MSVPAVVHEKSRGNKKCDQEEAERQNLGLFGIALKWPWHGCVFVCNFFHISTCSSCRGQHADANRPNWSIPLFFRFSGVSNKKLSYRRVTARCVLSVVMLPITTQQCRNYLYDNSWPNRWYEHGGFGWRQCVINRRQSSCVYHLYTDDFLWRNFLSPQCRNCSRDPDRAHLRNTHSSQD